MFRGLLMAIKQSLAHDCYPTVLLDYPHSFIGVKHLLDYLASMLLLHILRLERKVFVVVDNMDPPTEHAEELRGQCWNSSTGVMEPTK